MVNIYYANRQNAYNELIKGLSQSISLTTIEAKNQRKSAVRSSRGIRRIPRLGGCVAQRISNFASNLLQCSGRHRFVVSALASYAIICASLINFLRFNHYPFFRFEVGIVAASLLALTILVGILHQNQRQLGKAILEGLLIFFVLDQNGAGTHYAALAAAVIGVIVLVKRITILPFFGVAAVATITLGFVGIGADAHEPGNFRAVDGKSEPTAAPPAVLHIILDEHIGIEGFPKDNPRSESMKDALTSFYLSNGFRLFGRAYSEHFHTVNSIPQMLNFGRLQPPSPTPAEGAVLSANAYFDLLRARGYRLHVRQSDFIDYCQSAKVVACDRYDSARLAPVANLPISVTERAGLIGVRFFLLSKTAENLGNIYSFAAIKIGKLGLEMPGFGLALAGRVSSVNAIAAFDDLIEDLESARPGDAYFAHILLPHYPHATTAQCDIRNVDEWMLRRSKVARRLREQAYFDQILCATTKLNAALNALERSPARKDFVVIVHGDHGSRITEVEPIVENVGKIDDEDIIAGFSTIFAIRGNAIKPDYIEEASPVSTLLRDFSRKSFRVAPRPYQPLRPTIHLDNSRWIPAQMHPLPKKWWARPTSW